MRHQFFTLMELLITIGIIIILAGLGIPAVMKAQEKGRITTAKADMAAILTALKGVEGTYHKMVVPGGSYVPTASSGVVRIDGTTTGSAYNKFIVELSDPAHTETGFTLNINRRKIKFLDPKTEYDPSQDIATNADNLWRDPWGHPYVILINTDFSDRIPNPKNTSTYLSAKAVMYSFGPNGTDDSGLNVLDDDASGDDICSWK